ncbi:MAG: type VI secretion system accessory protein TagJ [Phycisphaerae bacterium]
MTAKELLQQGKLEEARKALQDEVRAKPTDAKLRVFLFQLMAVQGEWEKALNQLNVAADLDAKELLTAEICRPAIAAEALRAEILAGRRSPLVFGEPEDWIGWLLEANKLLGAGHPEHAAELRDKAFEAAPATSGTINGQAFEWIADADQRLGPVLEALVDKKYYWIPFHRIARIEMEPPADLRDLVWAPATFTWATGTQAWGLIPVRYPETEKIGDNLAKMARKTEWLDRGGTSVGVGQRLLTTDAAEVPLLEVRELVLNTTSASPAPEAAAATGS